jgi:hypothetical protein
MLRATVTVCTTRRPERPLVRLSRRGSLSAGSHRRAAPCWALDLAGFAWRQSHRTISVSARVAVARLGELIGLKA